MLNIWKRDDSFIINCQWSGARSKDDFKVSNFNMWQAEAVENTPELVTFKNNYKLLENKHVEITENDIIYFFKESKYPRFKFNSNCNNLKTIQIPKATLLVTPIVEIFNNHLVLKGVVCTLTNKIYFSSYNSGARTLESCQSIYKKSTPSESFIALLQDKFLIQGSNYREVECLTICNYSAKMSIKTITEINDNIDICITEKNLESYITSKNVNVLNDDMYNSLNTMLSSNDSASVELGIKMLNNFDIKKYALKIGSLLRLNRNNISNNKALSTVGFKNVLFQLNTTWYYIKETDNLIYYNTLYNASTIDIDKLTIKDYVAVEIKCRLETLYETCIKDIIVPITLELNIT